MIAWVYWRLWSHFSLSVVYMHYMCATNFVGTCTLFVSLCDMYNDIYLPLYCSHLCPWKMTTFIAMKCVKLIWLWALVFRFNLLNFIKQQYPVIILCASKYFGSRFCKFLAISYFIPSFELCATKFECDEDDWTCISSV